MILSNLINKLKEPALQDYLSKYAITDLWLFGSYSRNEQTEKSDIDLLFKYDKNQKQLSLFDLVDMQTYLGKKLGKKVDLIEKSSLKKSLRAYVLADLKKII